MVQKKEVYTSISIWVMWSRYHTDIFQQEQLLGFSSSGVLIYMGTYMGLKETKIWKTLIKIEKCWDVWTNIEITKFSKFWCVRFKKIYVYTLIYNAHLREPFWPSPEKLLQHWFFLCWGLKVCYIPPLNHTIGLLSPLQPAWDSPAYIRVFDGSREKLL